MENFDSLLKKFNNYFKNNNCSYYFSPGRVNIIGEHIDYNGGHVMPMAISLGIYAIVSYIDNPHINVVSLEMDNTDILSIDMNDFTKTNDYRDYIKGILYILKKKYNFNFNKGFEVLLHSTLPVASGLSSSASMELLFSHIINDYYNLNLSDLELVNISVSAERVYINVNCGIMDQFAIGMSEKNKVLYLDTNKILYEYIDFELGDNTLLIINTNKPRQLIESKYNERRNECEKALQILNETNKKLSLCDFTLNELNAIKDKINDDLYKRCCHVIQEEKRVKDSIIAFKNKDFTKLGTILNESHKSLRYNYEVSGKELDTIFDLLHNNPLVLGIRMTGAGFGGCAIALFNTKDKDKINEIMKDVQENYNQITNLKLTYYFTESSSKTYKVK